MTKSLMRRAANRLLHSMARVFPGSTTFRPLLHRLRGVQIHGKVFIGDDVYLENEYPECIELHDESAVDLRSTLIAHFRGQGKIVLQKQAKVGACCTVVCSPGRILTIGEGAFVAAGSVVKKDVPAFTLVAGVPANPIARISVPATQETSYEDFKKGLIPLQKCTESKPPVGT